MAVYLGKNKVGVTIEKEKPDMLQARVDATNSCDYLFYYYSGASLDFISRLDTSNVTSMKNMFQYCRYLTTLDISGFNTENVTNMIYMFGDCESLTTLDVSSFNTENVTNMSGMFSGCRKLETLDLSSLNVKNVTKIEYMFTNCSKLLSIDMSIFDFSKINSIYHLFDHCGTIKTIKGIDCTTITNTNQAFTACYALEELEIYNVHSILNLYNCRKLTKQTVLHCAQELWDMTGQTIQTFSLASEVRNNIVANTYVKLIDITDEMRLKDEHIDKKKPFVECEPTDEGAMTLTEYAISKNWAIA